VVRRKGDLRRDARSNTEESMQARPIVKWAGGKSKLLHELLPRVPTEMRTYAEPFAGGAALFFAVAASARTRGPDARRFRRAILSDRNDELVASYRAVRDDVAAVVEALRGYRYDRELFYEVRERSTAGMSDPERAARLVFLNRTCFNGLWRENSRGQFNVPFGRYKNPKIVDEPALRAASEALQGVELRTGDFQDLTRELGAGDFVYFDPPYAPASPTADFTTYSAGGFGPADQRRLADELRSLRARGVLAMLSNADTKDVRDLYFDFTVHTVSAPRSINSVPERRGPAREVLVTSWEQPAEGRKAPVRKARRP
jgi:DNA adenine methylase